MNADEAFLDTNILLYLLYLLSGDAAKANRAEELIAAGGVISVQVLNEFASVALRKLGMSWAEIREVLETVRSICRIEPLSLETHDRGLAVAERYGFSVYDSLILASALLADCKTLFSEDLQDGQRIDGRLTVTSKHAGLHAESF